jgi:choline-sulfatase
MHRARAAYYGLVETLDGHLARLRAAAQAAFGDEVLFVYSSDHGDMASSRGLFWKQNFYEGAVRVPLLVAGPGISAGHRLAEPTSLMDLGVSLLSAAGAEAMIETDGENLWPAL